jgi:CBS domain-containing protein
VEDLESKRPGPVSDNAGSDSAPPALSGERRAETITRQPDPPARWQSGNGFSDPDFLPDWPQPGATGLRERSTDSNRLMQVQEIMARNVAVVDVNGTLQDAAESMRRCNVGLLPVCELGRPVGVLTDRDITIRAGAAGDDPSQVRARDVMSQNLHTCFLDEDVRSIARLMQEKQIRRVLVTDHDGSLVGVVSLGDLAICGGSDALSGKTLNRISESNEADVYARPRQEGSISEAEFRAVPKG